MRPLSPVAWDSSPCLLLREGRFKLRHKAEHCELGPILYLGNTSCLLHGCLHRALSHDLLKSCLEGRSQHSRPTHRAETTAQSEQTFFPPKKVIGKTWTFLGSLLSWFADCSIRKYFWSYTICIPKKLRGGKKYGNNGIKTFMLLNLQNKFKTHVFFLSNFFLQIGPYSSHCLIFAKPEKNMPNTELWWMCRWCQFKKFGDI